ncbi:hypothetical protein OG625_22930 [Streptomyces sp. NBC_01351]|uniref:hypothetical protein n=1 Tax=Streptomyces sp. NBC_01351 TaxID=2903833 RepID=UPI002E32BC9C|nr:hypothetical protein [Streptomyces sp. NBC_01351]
MSERASDAVAAPAVVTEAVPDAVTEAEPDAGAGAGVPAPAAGRDPLREAVAAWVASADAGSSGRVDPDADAASVGSAEPASSPAVATAPAARKSDSASAVEAGKPASDAAPAPAKPAFDEPVDSERTAVFRVGKPASASADEAAPAVPEPAADEPVDSERTAVFRAVKPGSVSPAGDGAAGAAKAAADEPVDSERTAVFRAVKPGSAPAPAPAAPKPAADESADSERTAVFRAVKPGSVSPAGDGAADAAKPVADEPVDSERTAVFRAVKPGSASPAPAVPKPPADEPVDSERTAVFRAVKPGSGVAPAAPKNSTFVPLRTDAPGQQQGQGQAPAPAPAQPKPAPSAPKPAAKAPVPAPAADRGERTMQQPLPPKPPLDLLADLTNNPPPPPSPMRTAVRRFKIYAPIVVLLAVILAVVQLVRPLPQPKLVMTANSSYTFGGSKPNLPWPSEGQAYMAAAGLGTLGQFGEQKPVPIASVTKSMTAYIILRDHPFKKGEKGAMIDIDKTAETEGQKDKSDNESTLNTVKEGDKISEYDAIAALMIPSANNIARLLARWDSGSQEAFVKKMNDTAKELGMTNTTYTDPSGLDATTVSTAEDQVKLGLKIVEIEALVDITKKPSWVDPSGKTWTNWNRLVPFNDSLGIKTGTTTKAGGNLLFAAQKKIGNTNQLIVGAVLGQHKSPIIDTVIAASKQLMLATQKALEGAPVVKKGEVVGYVDDGLGTRTPVVATADVQAVGWASLTVEVKLADGGGVLPQTAKAGTEIGVLTVGEGASQVKVPVALRNDLVAPGIGSKLTRVG